MKGQKEGTARLACHSAFFRSAIGILSFSRCFSSAAWAKRPTIASDRARADRARACASIPRGRGVASRLLASSAAPDRFAGLSARRRCDLMSDPKKAATNDEIHGYDALDRLESESFDGTSRSAPAQHSDSVYDQLWLGEDNFHLGQ